MIVQVFQHVPFEGPAGLTGWFRKIGAEIRVVRLFAGESPFPIRETDWLVVMGGPMSANDEEKFPWMAGEKRFVAEAAAAGKTVLGICLGAQLIASALGARVYANPEREIGWFPVGPVRDSARTPFDEVFGKPFDAFHWHGETFDLPPGAVQLARSAACENQAFAAGDRVLGLQFHVETTPESAKTLVHHCGEDLRPGRYVQDAKAILGTPGQFLGLRSRMEKVLELLGEAGSAA
jgi:GMP synthase-like glutamine amidotransferase